MTEALSRFAEALRSEGVRVSPAEVVDAGRAAEAVGPERRDLFRAALRATLVKSPDALPAFDRVFERFFAPPARGSRRGDKGVAGGAGLGGRRAALGEREVSPAHRLRPQTRYAPDRPRPETARPGRVRTEGARKRLGPAVHDEARARDRDSRRRPRVVSTRSRSGGGSRSVSVAGDPLRRDLKGPWATEEERRLAELLPAIVEQLRLGRGRRSRRSSRGRLWARRLFRQAAAREGVPFVLPFRDRSPQRVRVVLLVDVSWSTARAAGYFLAIATELLALGRRHRAILFVDRPVDATEALSRWGRRPLGPGEPSSSSRGRPAPGDGIARGGTSFARLLGSLAGLNLEAASDYGRAFHALLRSRWRPRGRDTILVILGDARTNRFEPLPWALEEISRQCRAVLWLVPEPRQRWGEGDSALRDYLPHVDTVVEAADLRGLAQGVSELLGRL